MSLNHTAYPYYCVVMDWEASKNDLDTSIGKDESQKAGFSFGRSSELCSVRDLLDIAAESSAHNERSSCDPFHHLALFSVQ